MFVLSVNENDDPEVDERIETLKEAVGKMLSNAAGKAIMEELLTLIDALQRLGVAYHFEYQINQALQSIYDNYVNNNSNNGCEDDDLYTMALGFRLLRQQGYSVSSGKYYQGQMTVSYLSLMKQQIPTFKFKKSMSYLI